jgi:Tfp pilus assembly protein PilZ
LEGKKSGRLKGQELVDHFINKECRSMVPREIRKNSRKNIYFNTYLYLSKSEEPLRTNLWNISEDGCFVITTSNSRQAGDFVFLQISELYEKKLIRGQIKWIQSWGKDVRQLPGFGVAFVDITTRQHAEIKEILVNY